MTQTEALKLALEALKHGVREMNMKGCALECMPLHEAITVIKEALAQPEYDYKDLYEKEKRRSAMWLAKYEEVAGPAPKAYPLAQPEQAPVAYLVMGPYEKTAFSDIGSANAYCRGLNKGFDTDAYIVSSLYTTPPQRKPLTRAVLWKLWCDAKFESAGFFWLVFARAIEAAHGIKE